MLPFTSGDPVEKTTVPLLLTSTDLPLTPPPESFGLMVACCCWREAVRLLESFPVVVVIAVGDRFMFALLVTDTNCPTLYFSERRTKEDKDSTPNG